MYPSMKLKRPSSFSVIPKEMTLRSERAPDRLLLIDVFNLDSLWTAIRRIVRNKGTDRKAGLGMTKIAAG